MIKRKYNFERTENRKDIKIIVNNGEKSITMCEPLFANGESVSDVLIQEILKIEKMIKLPIDLDKVLTGHYWFGDNYLLQLSLDGKKGSCMENGDAEIAYTQAIFELISNLNLGKEAIWVG